jgi:hypothetical protein
MAPSCSLIYKFDVPQMKLEQKLVPICRVFQSLTCVAQSRSRIYLQSEKTEEIRKKSKRANSLASRTETRGRLLQGHDDSVLVCRAGVVWRVIKITGSRLLG